MKALYSSLVYRNYFSLLQRYARRIVANEQTAVSIALHVLWDHHCTHGELTGRDIRTQLKNLVRNRCFCQQQINIFDRPTVSPFLKPRPRPILNQPTKKLFL